MPAGYGLVKGRSSVQVFRRSSKGCLCNPPSRFKWTGKEDHVTSEL